MDYFEIFNRLRENQLTRQFAVKFNLLLFFLISYYWECFMPIRKNLSMMTVLKRQNKPLQHVQIKTLQNLKMSVTRIYKYVCYEMNVFIQGFHKSLTENP